MSELGIDPLGGLPADVGESTARDHAAVLVKGDGISVEQANAALLAKGFAPLNTNSAEYFSARKDALLGDAEFQAAYGRGDPGAISSLYQIDLRISQASGKLTDRSIAPNDPTYDAVRWEVGHNVSDAATYTTYAGELTGLASSIEMPAASAASLASDHFAAIRTTAGMSPDELGAWGDAESSALQAAVGEGAEAKIAEASKVLSQKSGRKLDLNAIARTNGARVAINLYFQSMSIKGVK